MNVEEILENAGAHHINEGVGLNMVEGFLNSLNDILKGCDKAQVELAKTGAIQVLADAGIRAPSRVVAAVLKAKEPEEEASTDNGNRGQSIILSDPEPWDYPVEAQELLGDIVAFLKRFLVLPQAGPATVALWIVHTYGLAAFFISPILAVLSSQKRCGKTLALDILGRLVSRPLFSGNLTAAVAFRAVEKFQPTLLIDEADTYLPKNDELKCVLNSGHRKATATIVRAVGEDFEPRVFSCWSAKSIAGIGKLPDTLEDRSIVVEMRRKTPREQVERLRQESTVVESEELRQRIRRWFDDNLENLRKAEPEPLAELSDRGNDNWLALLGVADIADGEWPKAARAAAKILSGKNEENSVGEQLLEDIKSLFQERHTGELTSQEIVDHLVSLEGRPWPEWKRGKPITKTGIARLLGPFKIKPTQFKVAGEKQRGYLIEQFKDAFLRYTSQVEVVPTVLPSSGTGFSDVTKRYREGSGTVSNNGSNPDEQGVVPLVPDENWEYRDIGEEETSSVLPEEGEKDASNLDEPDILTGLTPKKGGVEDNVRYQVTFDGEELIYRRDEKSL